jgi:hypothetical protein
MELLRQFVRLTEVAYDIHQMQALRVRDRLGRDIFGEQSLENVWNSDSWEAIKLTGCSWNQIGERAEPILHRPSPD